jgi:trk system potassium uptake protein TrkA
MRVAIAGAGKVGTYIANNLQSSGHEVIVAECDPAVVARQCAQNPGITWETGDVCEVSFLERIGLADVDVLVAATGDDEDNLVASLLAKQEFAVPRVIARVNHPKNEWLFNETWGVDVAVSTPHLLTSLVEEAVSVGSLVRLLQLNRGDAQLVEVTLATGSPAAGHSLSSLAVPRGATVVAVLRDRHVVVPRGDTVLGVDDEVILLVTAGAEDAVRSLLVG